MSVGRISHAIELSANTLIYVLLNRNAPFLVADQLAFLRHQSKVSFPFCVRECVRNQWSMMCGCVCVCYRLVEWDHFFLKITNLVLKVIQIFEALRKKKDEHRKTE